MLARWAVLCLAVGLAMEPRWPTAEATEAASKPIIVDTALDSYDGTCDDGDCSLRDAVASAPDGAVIVIPPGCTP